MVIFIPTEKIPVAVIVWSAARLQDWVKAGIDAWIGAAGISSGTVLRSINKAGRIWGNGFSPKVICRLLKIYQVHAVCGATELVGLRDSLPRRQGCQNLRCMVPLTMSVAHLPNGARSWPSSFSPTQSHGWPAYFCVRRLLQGICGHSLHFCSSRYGRLL